MADESLLVAEGALPAEVILDMFGDLGLGDSLLELLVADGALGQLVPAGGSGSSALVGAVRAAQRVACFRRSQ